MNMPIAIPKEPCINTKCPLKEYRVPNSSNSCKTNCALLTFREMVICEHKIVHSDKITEHLQ